eukprot:1321522-Prymnesium_polylepis.1
MLDCRRSAVRSRTNLTRAAALVASRLRIPPPLSGVCRAFGARVCAPTTASAGVSRARGRHAMSLVGTTRRRRHPRAQIPAGGRASLWSGRPAATFSPARAAAGRGRGSVDWWRNPKLGAMRAEGR